MTKKVRELKAELARNEGQLKVLDDVLGVCEKLSKQVAIAKHALNQYASPSNWGGTSEFSPVNDFWRLGNGPDVAKKALAEIEVVEPDRQVSSYRDAAAFLYQYVGATKPEAWLLDNLQALAEGKQPPHEWKCTAGETHET